MATHFGIGSPPTSCNNTSVALSDAKRSNVRRSPARQRFRFWHQMRTREMQTPWDWWLVARGAMLQAETVNR